MDAELEEATRALVTFFRHLPPSARAEYERLAELDRRYGEDVIAEMRERTRAPRR